MQAVCRRVAPVVDERIDGTRAIGPSGRLGILLRAGLRAHAVKCLTVSLKRKMRLNTSDLYNTVAGRFWQASNTL